MSQLANYKTVLERKRARRTGKRRVERKGGIDDAISQLMTVGARRRASKGGTNVSTVG